MEAMPWPEPAPEVARAVRAKNYGRQVPLSVAVRDRLGELFPDAEFTEAFAATGPAGWSPGRLALITVFQMAENLTDRQAAEAVRDKLSWMYALGLGLEDTGFDFTVLSQFRARVVEHGLEEKALDLLLARMTEQGLLAAGGKQRTDSTHVISAVRDLNRLELAGESVRAAVEALTVAAPHWIAVVLDVPGWSRRYDTRIDTWRMPASRTKRDQLALTYGRDGFALLGAVFDPGSPHWLRELPAVQTLRIVLLQNYTRTTDRNGREQVKRREKQDEGGDGLPPGHLRIASPYDLDTRWSAKRDLFWNGYKLHVTETCTSKAEDQRTAPNLITDVATTASTVPDVKALDPIHQRQRHRGVLPGEHYLDSGYASADAILTARKRGVALLTPVLLDRSRQARERLGFDAANFTIDWKYQQVTCPMGQASSSWSPCLQHGKPMTVVKFTRTTCGPCPAREQCTTGKSGYRQLTLHPKAMTDTLRTARAEQAGHDWRCDYALRSGVEGTIRQAVAVTDSRRARYRGLAKTHLEHVYSAVALNLIRLHAWWHARPLDRTRTSHLARLELTLAA
ncbi:IS1182 family transposase [Kitasatospora sp. NBC_00240]|uniref:IS1182 family transposase n=1 Tax=Kitasatospora sp. NBC_00240 TaxID=2903567 RepID=UPI00224CD5A5|nr:IS1182 family transposase [Kitasatospora sp. NBC_00240]MCX5215552.1 IS1182 family transposase [Kitasatospora sp. NBC_00240]